MLLKEFPELETKEVIEIAKLYTDRQARALEVGNKLVTSLIKAQKQLPTNQVNLQILTGDVQMGGAPSPGQPRRQLESRTPPADPEDEP